MRVDYGPGRTPHGPGVSIDLTGDEVATAIDAYLVAHEIHVDGPRTVTVNGSLCEIGRVYVDPSGSVIVNGERLSGRGPKDPHALLDVTVEEIRRLITQARVVITTRDGVIGYVMRLTNGRANPELVASLVDTALSD